MDQISEKARHTLESTFILKMKHKEIEELQMVNILNYFCYYMFESVCPEYKASCFRCLYIFAFIHFISESLKAAGINTPEGGAVTHLFPASYRASGTQRINYQFI